MNIGFDAKRFADNSRGLGSYARNLIAAMGKYSPTLKLHLYSPVPLRTQSDFSPQLPSNATLHAPTKRPHKWKQYQLRFIQIRKQALQHQLILYHGLSNTLPQKLPCPAIVTIHDLIFLHLPQFYPAIDRFLYRRSFQSAAQRADLIFAVSKATKHDICEAFSIPSNKVKVVYPFADAAYHPKHFSPTKQQRVRQTYQLPAHFILQLGALEPRKNAHMLLKAFSQLSQSIRKNFYILFAGTPTPYGRRLQQLAHSLGIAHQVRFLGHIPLKDTPALYAQARVCVYISLMEGFGLPILEALHCNTPCLVSNRSSMSEIAGPACLLANPQDPEHIAHQLQQLLTDNTLKKNLQQAIPKHIKQFSPQHALQQTFLGYTAVTGKVFPLL